MIRPPPRSPLFPYTTLFRSEHADPPVAVVGHVDLAAAHGDPGRVVELPGQAAHAARLAGRAHVAHVRRAGAAVDVLAERPGRSEEHTSELQSRQYLVCRLLL